ncbi:MAG: efflux RND transporter permease subunit [Cytophagales bacterium]|nr:efflux RND transporter permease subunit [Cytophagales bacterium]
MKKTTEKAQSVVKEFGLSTLSVKNKTTVLFLTAIILGFGLVSYMQTPKEAFPEVSLPTIYVGTVHPGNSPSDMENLITRPIEKELNSISGVDKITSSSVQDFSTIIIEFDSDTEVEEALQDVKDAVDKAELPSDLDSDPSVNEMNVSEFPIMNINLSGDYSFLQLKGYAEYLEDRIEKLDEISKVNIRGLQEEEVRINVDLYKMQALQLSFRDIENAISAENVTISGGNILTDGFRRTIRVVGEFKEVEELNEIIIKSEKLNIVYLKDIATVEFDFKERESYARLEGNTVVMLDVVKRSGKNLLAASDKINEIVDDVRNNVFPKDLEVTVTLDQTINTRSQVANLENSIISGVILVVAVLLFFLGTRNSLFVGLAIPTSMLLSFIILGALGITINTMVLFGLIMALGMLVDNGIVVVENVYRLMDEEGYSASRAAIEGVGEVAWPIIASTATTLAAFLPLAIWPGIMGEFMKFLPITLIIVLGSSLFVALVINPVFTALFMVVGIDKKGDKAWLISGGVLALLGIIIVIASPDGGMKGLGNSMALLGILFILNIWVLTPAANWFQNSFLPILENAYEKLLSFALSKKTPIFVFIGTWLLLFFSFALLGIFPPKVEFFPANEPNYVNIFVEKPLGTDIEVTNGFTKEIEKEVNKIIEPYRFAVNAVITQVGEGTSDPGDPLSGGMGNKTPHKARITVEFVQYTHRIVPGTDSTLNTNDVLNALRDNLPQYPGVQLNVAKNSAGPPAGPKINLEITGPEFEELINISSDIRKRINESGIKGIEKLKSDLQLGKPELIVDVDRKKARRYGVSSATIAMELRTSLFGKEISKFKQGEDDYPIQLRLADKYRYNKEALMNMRITFRDQMTGQMRQVPISAIADAHNVSTYGSVRRKNLDRIVTLYSDVLEGYNATEVNDALKELLADYQTPDGYSFKFTGEQESQEKEMAFLQLALMIALFLILLIIVAQFNRISSPVIILSSVLLSTIGVFLGLVIFNMDFIIIMTMIGIISLAGIVVNNAIVLIDYTILLMDRKKAELGESEKFTKQDLVDAVVKAGKTRLRPVLLTAITTVLGLIPLAIGLNIDFYGLFKAFNPDIFIGGENVIFWGPMSWTIIFGITFATFLTLIAVPVMFLLVERFKGLLFKRF